MADTITVLDGIQHAKDTDDDIWTLDGDGEAYEAVKSYTIVLPVSVSGARVIFNGNYDPDGGRCHVRVKLTQITDADPVTKTENTQSLEWSTVTPPAMLETGAIDVSGGLQSTLHIDVALSSTTASTGLEVIVQTRSETGLDEWTTLTRFVGPIGTGSKADFGDSEAAGQTELTVTNPATANLDHVGKFIFLEDTGTIANCEIAWLVSQTGD